MFANLQSQLENNKTSVVVRKTKYKANKKIKIHI